MGGGRGKEGAGGRVHLSLLDPEVLYPCSEMLAVTFLAQNHEPSQGDRFSPLTLCPYGPPSLSL